MDPIPQVLKNLEFIRLSPVSIGGEGVYKKLEEAIDILEEILAGFYSTAELEASIYGRSSDHARVMDEATAKQFEEALGRTRDRQKPTLEELQREPTPGVWPGNRVELLEDVDIFPQGSQGTVLEIFVNNNQVGYWVQFSSSLPLVLDRSQFKVVEDER